MKPSNKNTKTAGYFLRRFACMLALPLGLPVALFNTQLAGVLTGETPVNKEINISISRDTNYNLQVYDKTFATLHVIIFTVKNHKQTTVWHKVYNAMAVKQYPGAGNALQQTVQVKNIYDGQEQLFVTCIVTYYTNGSILQIQNGTSLLSGQRTGKLSINI
jgi:hypothetical protein